MLRVAMLVAGLCVLCGGWWAVRAEARSERMLLDLGAPMMRYEGAGHQNKPTLLRLNGAAMYVSSGNTSDSVTSVLDHFHAACKDASPSPLAYEWNALERQRGQSLFRPAVLDGVLRAEEGDLGAVACFDTRGAVARTPSFWSRVEAMLAQGDISEMGELRYVRAERANGRTVFLTVWTEGAVKLWDMFPPRGDAPGVDPVGVPRPEAARRRLSVAPSGQGELLNIYELSARNPSPIGAAYREQLARAGFRFFEKRPAAESRFVVASDGRTLATVSFSRDGAGRETITLVTRPD